MPLSYLFALVQAAHTANTRLQLLVYNYPTSLLDLCLRAGNFFVAVLNSAAHLSGTLEHYQWRLYGGIDLSRSI